MFQHGLENAGSTLLGTSARKFQGSSFAASQAISLTFFLS